ncbi:hypothetical protein [Ekhidna sp.]|uniref:hypothetical protein n=1 Tax=Ekhidna sp. TaxID=2608089 RepID=UPI003519B9A2
MKSILISLLVLTGIGCNAQINLSQLDGFITSKELTKLEILGENGINQLLIDDTDKNYLRLSVKSEELYVASLCICNEKNEVSVLHASAALGQILYKKSESSWTTNQKFDWQMREEGMEAGILEKRKRYLDNFGWVANTMGMGQAGETEFIIDRNKFKGELKLAIGLMTARDPNDIIGIPISDGGDCADHMLVSGDPKSSYYFDPSSWIVIMD